MKPFSILILCVLLLNIVHISNESKILGIFPMPSKSHHILGEALLKGLAERGHQVTIISPFKSEKPMKNFTNIVLEEMLELKDELLPQFTSLNTTTWQKFYLVYDSFPELYRIAHNNTKVKQMVQRNEKFDICIVSFMLMESMFGLCNAVHAPAIGFSVVGMTPFLSYHTNNPVPYSYVPSPFLRASDQMTFFQRVKNVLTSYFFEAFNHALMAYHQLLLDRYYPNSPKIEELMNNVDLYLMNSHIATDSPKPLLPNIIPIGGFHLQMDENIPTDIRHFLDSSKKGVVYLNLGSNAKSSELAPEIRKVLLNVMTKIDYDVLWKYETDLPNKPENMFIAKWLPQRAVLKHPNVKMFLTHGGLGGTVEAIYNGVPMVCMPMFGDQGKNCAESEHNGYAIVVDLISITEEKLMNAINQMGTNSSYKENIMLKSDLYRNQEINPMERAAFWVEHVIRHKGAKHMKPRSCSIPWHQYHLLDVGGFLFGILLIILVGNYFIIKLGVRLFRRLMKNTGIQKDKNQ